MAAATLNTVKDMSLAFTNVITPLGSTRATRVKAWRNWFSVLTWAPPPPQSTLDRILPIGTPSLQAMLWDFTSLGASNSALKSIVDAVVARHREAQLPSPAHGHTSYSRLTRCLARVLGRPHAPKPGITRDMVVALLRSNPTDLFASSNKNATVTLTISCMRPAGGAAALSCDLDYNSEYNAGLHHHLGCTTLNRLERKTGPGTQGPPDALGVATDPQLDVNHQLGLFMDLAGTWPSTNCNCCPGKRCTIYQPLFPKLTHYPHGRRPRRPSSPPRSLLP
jgi:hypothetical protein